MKILLTTLNSKFIHTNLAIRYIKAYCDDIAEISIKEFTINHREDEILEGIYESEWDIIAFSCYIWNIEETLYIAENLKKIKPNIKIIFGGPEVTYNPKEVLEKNKFIDFIIRGEGERTFKELILEIKNNNDFKNVKGIAYRNQEKIEITTERDLIQNLDEIPSPYEKFDYSDYKNKIIYYESSRGCPFNCQYCLSSTIKGVRFFSIERVKKDLQKFIDAKVKQVKFIDRTFNAKKDHALALVNFLRESDNKFTNFHFEVAAHIMDDEILKALSQCRKGLIQIEIGIQSTHTQTLKEIGRGQNFDKITNVVKTLSKSKNIHQHVDLIAGLPYEGYQRFKQSFNDVFNLEAEHFQLGFLKLIRGSKLREEKLDIHGYEFRSKPPYEILSNKYISYEEILKLKKIEEMMELYWNSHHFILSTKYLVYNYYKENPFSFFEDIAIYWKKNNFFEKAQGRDAQYRILFDFYKEKIKNDKSLFLEILKFDYVSLGVASFLPEPFKKIELEDFKNRSHKFLQNENNIEKHIPQFKGKPAKYIIKKVSFYVFEYDILKLKENIFAKLENKITCLMFNYDIDVKIAEKSEVFSVEI